MRCAVLLLVVVIALTSGSRTVRGECCHPTYIQWSADSCWPFEHQSHVADNIEKDLVASMMLPTRCETRVCNDGRVHPGAYCGRGRCNLLGCDCKGGCIPGDPVLNFRRLNDIPDAAAGSRSDLATNGRSKRSKVFKDSRAASKIVHAAYDGYKEGKLSGDQSRRDAERARNNAMTTAKPTTPSYVQRAHDKYKPKWT
ncbi:unnamed protein product [Arctia plantaginis]|uniref:Uncharacterized protein n=1 Tax=Arctia plantaginis TaxID=874455 RepID=A0A8S1B3X4_ARCPL|nr:unnamed protein product [Arctia plantaginis]